MIPPRGHASLLPGAFQDDSQTRREGKTEMRVTLLGAAILAMIASAAALAETSAFKTTQASEEWRIANYVGKPITNDKGEKIGNIDDVLFDRSGKITTVVIGVGGFLGLGEKKVALPFEAITYSETEGKREIMVPLSKEALQSAPEFKPTEKTTMDKVKETAGEVAHKATEKAVEMKDQAAKKIEEYRAENKPEEKKTN
jgi:sporulation protein YlmC with PRC-barrel domain